MDFDFIFTGEDLKENWFYNKYYVPYHGGNNRYYTFQIALNLLMQYTENPTIIETGCQRLKNDIGGGMSTSIFSEYINRYGGKLITVDIDCDNIFTAKNIILENWPENENNTKCIVDDSVSFLKKYSGKCNLLYLDSFDYPYVEILNKYYNGQQDWDWAVQLVKIVGRESFIKKHYDEIKDCQEHTVKEFKAIEDRLKNNCILLIDDNSMTGGGKSRLLKDLLKEKPEWICLLDFQQSLWIKKDPKCL